MQSLDLLASQLAPSGEIGEDALAHGACLRHHLPSLDLGRIELGFALLVGLAPAPSGLHLRVAPLSAGIFVGLAKQASGGLLGSGPDLGGRLVGGGEDAGRLLAELRGHHRFVEVDGGDLAGGVAGHVQLAAQPIALVLGSDQLV